MQALGSKYEILTSVCNGGVRLSGRVRFHSGFRLGDAFCHWSAPFVGPTMEVQ